MITAVNLDVAYRDNLTTRSRDETGFPLLDFVKTTVNSFIKWDLLHFFHNNWHTVDTVENIARYIGRKTEAVQPELVELVEAGLVEQKWMGDQPVYALKPDETRHALVGRFIVACEDRHFRIKAVEHMIRGMR